MATSEPQIHAEMAAILDELPAIGKESTNKGLGFDFRGIEAILNAVNPLLGKHGVVPRPVRSELLHWEAKTKGYAAVVKVTYHFTARDGSYVEAEAIGEGHDFGDKAVSKAMTMAEKACLGQTFAIAYEDDPDGDTVVQQDQNPPAQGPAQGESGGVAAGGQGSGPAAPPAPLDPVGERWMVTASKVTAFIQPNTAGSEDRRTQIKAAAVKAGLIKEVTDRLDLDKLDENQLAALDQIVLDLTGNF